LPLIRDAHDRPALVLNLAQGRQQHRGQDGDDRDDHQQLDQREAIGVADLFA
jgi:hypothetical protein